MEVSVIYLTVANELTFSENSHSWILKVTSRGSGQCTASKTKTYYSLLSFTEFLSLYQTLHV